MSRGETLLSRCNGVSPVPLSSLTAHKLPNAAKGSMARTSKRKRMRPCPLCVCVCVCVCVLGGERERKIASSKT